MSVVRSSPDEPRPSPRTHVLEQYGRTVIVEHMTRHRWSDPLGHMKTTVSRVVERKAVTLTLRGNHSLSAAPTRPLASVHERSGPLDGPNLADIREKAVKRLVENRGGADRLAKRAVDGHVSETVRIEGDRPEGLVDWVYDDLTTLRERARNVSMTTTRGRIATFQENPPATLARKLRERRGEFLGTPGTYRSVAHRARVAARAVFLDRLLDRLDERAAQRAASESNLREELGSRSNRNAEQDRNSVDSAAPLERIREGYNRRDRKSRPGTLDGLRMRVDAEPAYLTRTAVGHDDIPAIERGNREHPLVTRNWNVLAVPYGDVVDAILGTILGEKKTRLRSGAQVLRAIQRANPSNATVDTTALEQQVSDGVKAGTVRARMTLGEFDLGDADEREATVDAAMSRWETPGTRALALTNGTAAATIHERAVERWDERLSNRTRDLLATRLERDIREVTNQELVRPAEGTVNGTAVDFRDAVTDELVARIGDGVKNVTRAKIEGVTGVTLSRLPAGFPVAPAPGYWYATVNLWRVEVAGEYVRFTVRVPRGTPDTPGAQLTYVRDAGRVRLDVDEDGSRELLGRSTRLSFRTGTEVAIAVPPGPQGVGDVDGRTVEESPGWPQPGP